MREEIVIAAGSTGGHFFPALRIAVNLKDNYGISTTILGPIKKEFRTILKKEKISFLDLDIRLKKTNIIDAISYCLTLLRAILRSLVFLCRQRPKLVLGTGSFGSFPACVSAFFLNIPVIIHEQNTVPGLANRVLGKFAKKIFLAFPNTSFPESKVVLVGNPVNREITNLDKKTCYDKLALDESRKTLLVFGGSQGAFSVNSWFIDVLKKVRGFQGWQVIHITGKKDYPRIRKAYKNLGINSAVFSFLYPLDFVYKISDFAISRGGALSLSELSYWGVPSLIIPYAYSKADHQEYNALYFQNKGGAYLLKKEEMKSKQFPGFLKSLLNNDEKLKLMSENMKKALPKNALEKICEEINRYVK